MRFKLDVAENNPESKNALGFRFYHGGVFATIVYHIDFWLIHARRFILLKDALKNVSSPSAFSERKNIREGHVMYG